MAHAPPDQGCRAPLHLTRTPTVPAWQLNPFSRGGLCVWVCVIMHMRGCGAALVVSVSTARRANLHTELSRQVAPVFDKLAESRKKREPPLKSESKPTAMEASRAPEVAAPDHADEVLSKAADFLKVGKMKIMPMLRCTAVKPP